MARGSSIILAGEPRGKFLEGTITDTSKPGTIMEMVPATAFTGGRPSWRHSTGAEGARRMLAILTPDFEQGQVATAAYVSGTRCFLYVPIVGEEVNVLLADVTGTGDIVTQGDFFGVNTLGKLIANSSYAFIPFQAMETLAALTADALLWCMVVEA